VDTVPADESRVDFIDGILARADDDGRIVLPEHEIGVIFGQTAQGILLKRQVEVGIAGWILNIAHDEPPEIGGDRYLQASAGKKSKAICLQV
jgi:hypothetical protein